MRLRRPSSIVAAMGAAAAIAWAAPAPPPPAPAPTEIPAPPPTSAEGNLAAAPTPRDVLEQETRRADEALEALRAFGQELARQETEEAERSASSLERADELAGALRSVPAGSPEADRLYDRIVAELQDARPALRSALDARGSPATVPTFTPSLDPSEFVAPGLAEARARLEELRAEIDRERRKLVGTEGELRETRIELRGRRVERLDALRVETLDRLSRAKRAEILGISRQGVAQLLRELGQVNLSTRLWAATRLRKLHQLPSQLRDVFTVGSATYVLFQALLVLAGLLFVRSRGARILERARRTAFQRSPSVRWTRRFDALFGAARVLLPWGAFLIAVGLLLRIAGGPAAWPEVRVPLRIAALYGWYRLGIDVAYAAIVTLARRYRLALDSRRRAKVLGTVRSTMRVAVAILVLLALSEEFLGRGYLYHLVVRVAWVVGVLTALQILASWRTAIADAYLASAPDGTLARLVRKTRDRWYGVFVGGASFGYLAGHAGLILARDFAMGFDQTRRALAFLFRRRMEKQAEQLGYSEGRVEELAPELVAAFTEEPTSDGPLVVDHFPGHDLLEKALTAWRDGRTGGSFVVVGETGMGKSTWLDRIDTGDLPRTILRLDRRARGADDLATLLGPGLLDASGIELDRLRRELAEGPRRVAAVDAAQNLFLATVGGYDAFRAFVGLVEATRRNVFWVCAFNAFAWEHLRAVRPELAALRLCQTLPAWTETNIRELLRRRVESSGVTLSYEDLVLDRMEGVSAEARLLQTEEGYTRLLWDYADGNPRVALHFWLRSLVPETPRRARVRLFRAPRAAELESGGETGLFLLAALVTHENLTIDEASAATGYPASRCGIHLDRYVEGGVLRLDGDRYRLTTQWNRTVIRLLRRRNLISD